MSDPFHLRVLVDFDGTICPNHYPEELVSPPDPECIRLLRYWRECGYEIVIYSCRSNPDLGLGTALHWDMVDYLKKHDVPYDAIEFNKPHCEVIIDDRAIPVRRGDWSGVQSAMANLPTRPPLPNHPS